MKAYFPKSQVNWFYTTMLCTAILAVIYISAHSFHTGQKIVYLTNDQLVTVNTILKQESDSISEDILRSQLSAYLSELFDTGIETDEYVTIEQQVKKLNRFDFKDLPAILPSYPFRVPSVFWLFGSLVFVELIFWSLFGLGASILYRASEAMSDGTFDIKKLPIHLAKLIYAPFSTVVIFLSIEVFFNNGSIVVDDISSWVIVLAFILGFYSGRTVDLLRRLKDVLLPLGSDAQSSPVNTTRADTFEIHRANVMGVVRFADAVGAPLDYDYSQVRISVLEGYATEWSMDVFPQKNGEFIVEDLPIGIYGFRAEGELQGKIYHATVTIALEQDDKDIRLLLQPFVNHVFQPVAP